MMDYKPFHAAANTIPLLLVALFGLSLSAASQYDHTYYVTPNVSSCTNVNNTCQDFKTYFNNASYYFQSGTEFIFLPGIHLFDLGSILSVQDIVNIRLVGSDNFTQRSVAEDVEEYGFDPYAYDKNISYLQSSAIILCTIPSALSFSNVTNLTLANFTMLNCGQYVTTLSISSSIDLSNVYNLLIDGLSVQNSSGYGLYGLNVLGQSQIIRSSFVANNQFVKNILKHVPIKNCMNETGRLYLSESSKYKGGNVEFLYSDINHTFSNFHLDISFVLFALGINGDPCGAGLSLSSDESLYNLSINIDDLVAYRNYVGNGNGANFCFDISSPISNITLTNIFSAYATSVGSGAWYSTDIHSTIPSCFTVTNATFECNFSYLGYGSSILISTSGNSFATLDKCTFKNDQSMSSLYISNSNNIHIADSSFHSCIVQVSYSYCEMNNCVLQNSIMNYFQSTIYFDGYNQFVHSKVLMIYSGVYLGQNNTFTQSSMNVQYSTLYLQGINMFSSNLAITSGGAIFLQSSILYLWQNSNSTFINNTATYGGAIYVDSDSSLYFQSPTNLTFINNTALYTGGAIYVETPASTTCFYFLDCTDIDNIHLYFEGNYAGDAGSVLYGGNIDTCQIQSPQSNIFYNSTYVFNTITDIGNHDPSTSLISSDSPCIYPCDALTNLVCLTGQSVSLYQGQIPKVTFITVGQRNGIVPTVILIFSKSGNRVINVFKTLKQCSSYEIPYEYENGTMKLMTNSGLNFYSLNISILPCPALFINNNATSSCICDPLLQKHNLVCNISDVTVLNTGNIWIGLTSQGAVAFQDPCPFDYCSRNKTINVLDLDSHCSYNRSGALCGQCQGNLSMTFGTSQCASCSNYYLLLIIVFIVMGVLLVVVLFVSKFTVSNGALNGIVLYSNLIRTNDTTFFQNRSGYSSFLSVFIAWINLDLGIETCFYNGMDSYAKTWLQFVFPMSLIAVVILAARYSSSLSNLFRFNAVPVLSTLVLLSYSKILQTIITIFSSVSLNTMNSAADSYVWQYDGNIEYFGQTHLPLFIFGLVVIIIIIIPYLAILLMAPCLQTRSHWRGLQWVNKLKPFLDSYQAPFKDRYRFWPGVLLFIRLPLYLVFILSDSTPVKMLAIIACVLMYLCIAVGLSVYKKWSDLLIEMAFIINISLLSASVIAINNSGPWEIIISIGVTCAVVLTVCIIVYERVKNMCRKVPVQGVEEERKPLLNADYVNSYREPLLDDSGV